MNKIIIIGNATADCDVVETKDGSVISNVSVAVNRGDEATFFRVKAFNALAEVFGKFVQKGHKVAVEGRMICREYQDKDGNDRQAWEVIASNVEFLTPKQEEKTSKVVRRK